MGPAGSGPHLCLLLSGQQGTVIPQELALKELSAALWKGISAGEGRSLIQVVHSSK